MPVRETKRRREEPGIPVIERHPETPQVGPLVIAVVLRRMNDRHHGAIALLTEPQRRGIPVCCRW